MYRTDLTNAVFQPINNASPKTIDGFRNMSLDSQSVERSALQAFGMGIAPKEVPADIENTILENVAYPQLLDSIQCMTKFADVKKCSYEIAQIYNAVRSEDPKGPGAISRAAKFTVSYIKGIFS